VLLQSISRSLLAIVAACWLACPAPAAEVSFRDLTLEQAIRRLEAAGLAVLFSSDLVKPDMRVREEPVATEPRAVLVEIVRPYDLRVADGPNGSLLLVRAGNGRDGSVRGRVRRASDGAPVSGLTVRLGAGHEAVTDGDGRFVLRALTPGRYPVAVLGARLVLADDYMARVRAGRTTDLRLQVQDAPVPHIDEIIVQASLYKLGQSPEPSVNVITGAELQAWPGLGEDSLRAVERLPGAVAADYTAKSNIRGGENDETLVRFDGLRLYNPFHLKDFQNVFSAIDPGLVRQMDVSTGGFPARYGNRMSGVIDLQTVRPAEQPYGEVSLSLFNAAALGSGSLFGGDGDWLLSARRGNLDLMFELLASDLGSPTYTEIYGRLERRVGDGWAVSGNFLILDDEIELTDQDAEETARADYEDRYYWLRLGFSRGGLSGSFIVARSDLDSHRSGETVQPGVTTGELDDRRGFAINSLQTDWSWPVSGRALLQFGGEWRDSSGHYDFRDEAEFDLLFLTPGAPASAALSRELGVRPEGREYGAYTSLRLGLLPDLTAEAGLRWDRETLTPAAESWLSPRLGLLYALGPRTDLRASYGRFVQPQSINELQVSDGVTEFRPAQRADHWIASIEHRYPHGLNARVEVYRKDYDRLRPRFENFVHPLVLLPELRPDRIEIAPDGATAKGVELSLRGTAGEDGTWWASYAWSRVEDRMPDGGVPRYWDQPYVLGAGLIWRNQGWEFGLAARYHSGWRANSLSLAESEPLPLVAAGPRYADSMERFLSIDARLSRTFPMSGGDSLTAFLEVTNLTDRLNQCCLEYEVDDETGETLLETEAVDTLRILPNLGAIWRF
jgi:outer membrane receptor protein involved in Fe transport